MKQLYSSSKSRPKSVPLSHKNLMRTTTNVIKTYNLTPSDRTYLVMPLFHVHVRLPPISLIGYADASRVWCALSSPRLLQSHQSPSQEAANSLFLYSGTILQRLSATGTPPFRLYIQYYCQQRRVEQQTKPALSEKAL